LTEDALVSDITDRLERLVHTIGMVVRAGGLPRPATQALVTARIGVVAVLSKLNTDLVKAEQDDKPTIGAGS